jgi:hypothetical protein
VSSCSKSSDPEPVDQTPAISFVAASGFITTDATMKVNSPFKVRISASSNSNSKAALSKFTITWVIGTERLILLDTAINVNSINTDISALAYSTPGQEKWYFKVTDKNNNAKEIGITITTTATKSTGPANLPSPVATDLLAPRFNCSFAPVN